MDHLPNALRVVAGDAPTMVVNEARRKDAAAMADGSPKWAMNPLQSDAAGSETAIHPVIRPKPRGAELSRSAITGPAVRQQCPTGDAGCTEGRARGLGRRRACSEVGMRGGSMGSTPKRPKRREIARGSMRGFFVPLRPESSRSRTTMMPTATGDLALEGRRALSCTKERLFTD
jgi:hypothetical protein